MGRKPMWFPYRRHSKVKKLGKNPNPVPVYEPPGKHMEFPSRLQESLDLLKEEWANCADVKFQQLSVQGTPVCVIFIKGLVDRDGAQQALIEPLIRYQAQSVTIDGLKDALWSLLTGETESLSTVNRSIADGKVVVLVDGQAKALLIEVDKVPGRAVEASQNEPTIQGPQEAFVESLSINLALMRKKLRTPRLKVEILRLGTETDSHLAILYLEGVTKPSLIEEVRTRVVRIDIDGLIDANQIREFIEDNRYSPFRLTEVTERPDRAVAGLLQGRAYIFFDGSANVIAVPSVFIAGLISSEDYYGHYMISLLIRPIRQVMYWMSLLLPSLYIALLSYNQDLIPTPLLISLEAQHEGIPFPTVIEALVMQGAFETLREAGLRLPRAIGQSVSIVGALIIGDAAVNANIVSPGMVIVVAAAGVASFTIPSQDLVNTNRILQFPFMIMASVLGVYGIVALGLVLVIHMLSLRSFGVPYMSPLAPFSWAEMRDVILRAPWWAMKKRPKFYEPVEVNRTSSRPSSGDPT